MTTTAALRPTIDSGAEALAAQTALLVADGSCPKIRELLAEALVPVLWLEAGQPPLETVTAALAERRRLGQPVETLHWVSHGSPGVLQVAEQRIDQGALLAHQELIAEWGIRDLGLWSCKAGAKKNFISLWQELTGAQVWSSEGQLGFNRQGFAHWNLESLAAGEQRLTLPVGQQTLHSWPHQLAAPVASGTPTLTAVTEGTTTPAGDTVSNLFSSSFSDADSDTLLGVAITANAADSSTEGAWQYSTDSSSNWTTVSTTGLSDTTAFYLDANSKLRFLPNTDFIGTPGTLTARLIDSTYNGATESNSDYFLQFIETTSEVKATLTLDPTAFSANSSWIQEGTFATVVGLADAAIGGTVGTVASPTVNPVDKSDVTLSANLPLTGAQSTAPNLVFGQYSLPDSTTGDLFGLYSASNDLNAIIAYDQNMYNSLVNETDPVVSTATWNSTTLPELGVSEGTGTFSTTSGPLSFSGAYSIEILESGDTINVSTNGGATAISADALSLSTSIIATVAAQPTSAATTATTSAPVDNTPTDPAPAGTDIQPTDDDNDGLREVVTASDGTTIDGNRDGIADAEQTEVAGLRLINDGAAGSDYGAVQVSAGTQLAAVTLISPNSETGALTMTARDGSSVVVAPPSGITNSFAGAVAFNVQGVTPGGSTSTTINLPTGLVVNPSNDVYMRLNYSNNQIEEYVDEQGNPLYSFQDTDGDGTPDTVVLQLVDGDPQWDGDGEANGTIVDPGFLGSGQRNFSGTKRRDTLIGNVLGNSMNGLAGRDWLQGDDGRDVLKGGRDKDRLWGGLKADLITCGKDADRILYYSAEESTADQADTVKFGKKDRFQFRSFDGDSITEGQQSLRYIGKKAFTGAAGELRFTGSGLQADTTGDGQADFMVNFTKATPWLSEANILI